MRAVAVICALSMLPACSDAGTTATPSTTSPATLATTTTVLAHQDDSMRITTSDGEWTIPRTVCDPAEAAQAASVTAGGVEGLVGARASGWPTTTAPPPGGDELFEKASAHAGILTLALAAVAGTEDIVLTRWEIFEARYADEEQGYPPVTEISSRLDRWRRAAADVRVAIETECALSG